jgi:hypothetical protein
MAAMSSTPAWPFFWLLLACVVGLLWLYLRAIAYMVTVALSGLEENGF